MLIVILLATALYARVFSFGYVWDDSLLFLSKSALMNKPLTWGLLTEPVLPGTSYMRPLIFLTLYTEFHLFGQNPAISHGVNLFFFILNSLLVFVVCRRIALLTGRESATALGLLAATLYVVHPALVESSAWISGRFDEMVTLFMLLAAAVYLTPFRRAWPQLILLPTLMMLALLSKELGAVLPGVLLCLWIACHAKAEETPWQTFSRALRHNAALLLVLTATLALYLFLRTQAMHQLYHSALTADYLRTVVVGQLAPLEALKFYFVQTLLPFHSVSPLHPTSELHPYTPASLLFSAITLAGLLWLLLMAWYKRSTPVWLTMAGLLCLFPVLHFIPLLAGGNIGNERFMTAPLAFLAMAIVLVRYDLLLEHTQLVPRTRKRMLLMVAAGWALLATITTHAILPFWSNDLQLWNWAYHDHPTSGYARYNFLYGALDAGRGELVEKEIRKQQELHNGLEVGDQILYANLLTRTGNAEGIKYLEGIMYALPKFHELPEGRARADHFRLSSMQMGGVYSDYANGLMVFRGDATAALKYNHIAEWYLQDSEKLPVYYQRVAILYVLGRVAEAEQLYKNQEPFYYFRKNDLKKGIVQLARHYCSLKPENNQACIPKGNDDLLEKIAADSANRTGK